MWLNKVYRVFVFMLLFVTFQNFAQASNDERVKKLPIFDAHIHYSHDIWDAITPKDAIARLKAVGVKRAIVSSSSDEGTRRLYAADPEFVIPVLRPYRKRGTLDSWMYDETLIPYLRERVKEFKYAGIGEFHIDGEQAYTPVMQEIIKLAKEHDLFLHVHSDAQAVKFIYQQFPEARILWAHAGFDYAYNVGKMMDQYPNLWADLSFRGEIIVEKRLMKAWRRLLTRHPDRFTLGIDTYEPLRWTQLHLVMNWHRDLLAVIPFEDAKKIAYDNAERLVKPYLN